MVAEPGAIPGPNEANTPSSGTAYLGNVPHARLSRGTMPAPFGARMPVTTPGYKKGDQVRLLPPPGRDLTALQQSLVAAGYITQAQVNSGVVVFGSPDEITTTAFAKLLASSNMSGTTWKDTLSQRLAAAALQAPKADEVKTPPLTISLDDPEAIKATLNKTARSLLGGYMSPEQTDAFVGQFQAAQTAQQTAKHYQDYNPGVGYGPGGTTTVPDLAAQAESFAKTTDPDQYTATQFGSQVNAHLANLRSTGYLS
jgi:hypothetical protein